MVDTPLLSDNPVQYDEPKILKLRGGEC
jgi:hypothetical protein